MSLKKYFINLNNTYICLKFQAFRVKNSHFSDIS